MLSVKLRNLAAMLHIRPDLARSVAQNLDELAECAACLEHSAIPPQLLAAGVIPLPANVVRLERPVVRQ